MPLDITTLKSTLQTAFKANLLPGAISEEQEGQIADLAGAIANAMKTFVEGATITYISGLATGPGGGVVTGVFTNTIS